MKQLKHVLMLRIAEENLMTLRATRILDDFGEVVEKLFGVLKDISRAIEIEMSKPDF